VYRYWLYRQPRFTYSLGTLLAQQGFAVSYAWQKKFLNGIRVITLLALAFFAAKPQLVDSNTQISIDGIDIVLTLDVSGSMAVHYGPDDQRSRFQVAQEEALRFIKKRTNDAIGLVLFAGDALSRCPITMDKRVLQDIVTEIRIGEVDPNNTLLAVGMMTAVNRLKTSKAKSKVMILLTDGEPSEKDINIDAAIEVAKKLGIKIYVIGIGSDKDEMIVQNFFQKLIIPKLNKALLEKIAHETGGKAFMAHNADDMRAIYDTIDKLETVKHEAPIFSVYYDIYIPGVLSLIGLLCIETLLTTLVWFGL
jgi:Ca-activated chloride channel family protein